MKPSARSAARAVRPAACAGRFYPATEQELRSHLRACLAAVPSAEGPVPKAIIAPHAGYVYSGPIAASAYARLAAGREVLRRVVVVGPSHYASFTGLATTLVDDFATPLGRVPVDKEALTQLRDLAEVHPDEEAHRPEHCLEVQLPFLQTVLEDFRLVPLLVADTSDAQVVRVLETLWGGAETCVVVSSDLSHYHHYEAARQLDAATAHAIEALRAEDLDSEQACGCGAVRGLLRVARGHGLRCHTLDLRNSGDTAGPRDRVVGYGAFALA